MFIISFPTYLPTDCISQGPSRKQTAHQSQMEKPFPGGGWNEEDTKE